MNPLIVLILSFFLVSCSHEIKTDLPKVIKLTADTSLAQIDTFYLTRVEDIQVQDGHYFLSDNLNHTVFEVNPSFELVRTIGSEGNGPGEFISHRKIFITADRIYAHNKVIQCIEFDRNGNHIQNHVLDPIFRTGHDFTVVNNKMYYTSFQDTSAIVQYHFLLNKGSSFGTLLKDVPPSFNRSQVLLEGNEKWIVAIGVSEPIIQLYDLGGNLQWDTSFYNHPDLEESFSIDQETLLKDPNPNRIITWAISSQLVGNELYVLMSLQDRVDGYSCNKIAVFQLGPIGIQWHHTYLLPRTAYRSFAVDDQVLLAFDPKSSELDVCRIRKNPSS